MPSVAIACQGGGSHTAFTAGVLKQLLRRGVHRRYDLIGLSGTSGGALCALLSWQGLLRCAHGHPDPPERSLMAFWRDNTAQVLWEHWWNDWSVGLARLQNTGLVPEFKISPYTPGVSFAAQMARNLAPRAEFLDFQRLLEKHVAYEELATLVTPQSPRLLFGAVDVLSGQFKVFDSQHAEITLQSTLATAAIPTLFQAVRIGDRAYWDGLFSENPPIEAFLSEEAPGGKPDEIWIVQVNPTARGQVPRQTADILDRRNELAGNLSLFHSIGTIQRMNRWIEGRCFKKEFRRGHAYQVVKLRRIVMGEALMERLDCASKLDRSPLQMDSLIADGEEQADRFLDDPDAHEIPRQP
jgi:NTE family protein